MVRDPFCKPWKSFAVAMKTPHQVLLDEMYSNHIIELSYTLTHLVVYHNLQEHISSRLDYEILSKNNYFINWTRNPCGSQSS